MHERGQACLDERGRPGQLTGKLRTAPAIHYDDFEISPIRQLSNESVCYLLVHFAG